MTGSEWWRPFCSVTCFHRVLGTPGKSYEGTRLTFGPFCGWNWPISTETRPPSQLTWRAAAVAAAAAAAR